MSPSWTGVIKRRCKLACKRLFIASGQFGESQTPRKAELFEVAWTEQRTWSKFTYGHVLFEAAIYGERHTVRCSEAKSNCCIAYLVQVYLRTLWRKPNTEEKRSFFEVAWTEQRTWSKFTYDHVLFEAAIYGESRT